MAINFLSGIDVDNGVLYTDTTNNRVGVGTNSPGATFHVSGGAIRIDDAQQLQFGNGNVNIRNDSSGRMYLRAPLAYYFEGNGGYKMVLDGNSGNLGIGTTSPADKLHVEGTVRADSPGTSGWVFQGRNNLNTALSGIWFDNGDGELLLRDDANNLNVRLRSDSDSYFNGGNVGIGTTSPSSKLQVNGDLTVGDDSTVGSFINVIAAGASQDAGIRFGSESNTDSKAAIYTNTVNSDLHFDVTETTRMLIDSGTGNVGIGTTGPRSKLHVVGGVKLGNDTDSPSSAKAGTFRYYTSGNNSYVDMCMRTGASTYAWVNIVTNSW